LALAGLLPFWEKYSEHQEKKILFGLIYAYYNSKPFSFSAIEEEMKDPEFDNFIEKYKNYSY